MTEWYSIPEVAEILGVAQRDVRSLLNDGRLLAVRRDENRALAIFGGFIAETAKGFEPLRSLRGTVTLLRDEGLTDEEAFEWLTGELNELGAAPLDLLRAGNVHAVRRAVLTSLA